MKNITVKISDQVKEVLQAGKVSENLYFLPQVQLSREMYVEVNKILELLGGKWNRSKKAHIFESSEKAQSILGSLETGEVLDKKKTFQFFETPKYVAEKIVELADIKVGMSVLEPSAGHGAILDALPKMDIELHIIEIDREKCDVLEKKEYAPVDCTDFLSTKNGIGRFDRIIMNPPFTKGQDAEHVSHAYGALKEGGRLVSVMAASIKFNSQKRYQKLRELIEKNGQIIELADGSFKESGTKVSTVLIVLNKSLHPIEALPVIK